MMIARPPSGWQLVAEFAGASPSGDDGALLAAALATVQWLNLRPQQLERIRQVLQRAAVRALALPLHIRIWRMGSCTGDCSPGYFLVERQSGAPMGDRDTVYLVELFVYREREFPGPV